MHRFRFRVVGKAPFPAEMLATQECYPATTKDAAQLSNQPAGKEICVSLKADRTERGWLPRIAQWNARGYSVKETIEL